MARSQHRTLSEDPFEERRTAQQIKRLLRLLALLRQGTCTRKQIFSLLGPLYGIDPEEPEDDARLSRVHRMLERDLALLETMGVKIKRKRQGSQPAHYILEDEQGLAPFWSLSDTEVECLAFLASMFTDPYRLAPPDPTRPPPPVEPRHPFADEVRSLLERIARQLPPRQQRRFEQWSRTPYLYFNLAPVNDYFPHRQLITEIARAIERRQQVRFSYAPPARKAVVHRHLEPYYVIQMEGHFYLLAYHPERGKFLEFRVDRIRDFACEPQLISGKRRRQPITFRFWLDARLAEPGLSQRWLSQVVEREEMRVNEQGQEERWLLVRATAYNEWRVIQQLLRYGEKAELVEPASLREEMRQTISKMGRLYGLSLQEPEEAR